MEASYLHGSEAVLDKPLDPVVLGLLQDLIKFSVVIRERYRTIPQEVQNEPKMSTASI